MIDDFKDAGGKWMKGRRVDGEWVATCSHIRWNSMRQRCKEGGSTQNNQPTYIGCTMSPMFSDFQLFVEWHRQQVGYSIGGYHLDKDILVACNKLYSENTCVLVPSQLNMFLTSRGAARGAYPQGVCWKEKNQRFQASLHINGKQKHIGYYTTAVEASAKYKTAKEAEARRWHSRLVAKEFVVDERVIECMGNWAMVL